MARESADPSTAATATASNVEQDRESEPEIIEPNNRRATLPPDYDPERIAELHKLLDCKSKKELQKMSIDTIWSGIQQAGMALMHWELHTDQLDKQIDEIQTTITRKEGIIEFLTEQGGSRPSLSAKHPDPTPLKDNTDPKFEHWKLEMEGKFKRNADHFKTEEDKMIYVYGRTEGEAREHLTPRYTDKSFETAQAMIDYLATIYVNRYKVQNARHEYRRLVMKATQPFPEFYTKFSQLAGVARIPEEDLRPDLYDKLSFDLQKLILPTYGSLTTLTLLTDQCLLLDQENRRIKERMSRVQNRNASTAPASTTTTRPTAAATPPSSSNTLAPTPAARPSNQFTRVRPQYDDPARKALSLAGKCFKCEQVGHFSRDCLVKKEVNVLEESGKDEP
jgi:hypothetical protein